MTIQEFEYLLNRVKIAYSQSSLKDKEYHYSLVGTQIKKHQPLIIGLNWGGGKIEAQTVESYKNCLNEQTKFQDDIDMGSLSKIKPYLKKYSIFNYTTSHIGWTNYCFFRTPNEKELMQNPDDLLLTNDIFFELIKMVEPSMILSFSSLLRDYLLKNSTGVNFKIKDRYKAINEHGKNKYNGLIGELNGCKFYSLPHPVAHTGTYARNFAWSYCFDK